MFWLFYNSPICSYENTPNCHEQVSSTQLQTWLEMEDGKNVEFIFFFSTILPLSICSGMQSNNVQQWSFSTHRHASLLKNLCYRWMKKAWQNSLWPLRQITDAVWFLWVQAGCKGFCIKTNLFMQRNICVHWTVIDNIFWTSWVWVAVSAFLHLSVTRHLTFYLQFCLLET